MEKNKKLSIVIVSYNSKKNLENCIESIYKKIGSSVDWEIVVVNNDRNEELSKARINLDKVKIVDHKKNVGFGAGVNLGVSYADGNFLLFLNPDANIVSDEFEKVLKEFDNDKEIGIVGVRILSKKNEKQQWSAGREISFYDLIRNNLRISRSAKIWNSSEKKECDWVTGTALFIKKDFFNQLKGFDDDFFMYFEDMDLCKRTRALGKKVLFCPDYKICHGGGGSYDDWLLQKKHYYDSMEKYLKKHSKFFSLWVARFVRKWFVKK
jgi:GT2 family glycosyltransferase